MAKEISRRSFLKAGTAAAVGLSVAPGLMAKKKKKTEDTAPLNRKLKILAVGIGGRGSSVLKGLETEDIIGLCDVDWKYANKTFNDYPSAKRFKDWRVMLDEMGKSIDAVLVATPDHTHACVAAHSMTLGKHVYVQKPLTHSVYEARLLTKLAKKYKVATQMGNQGSALDAMRRCTEIIQSGILGEVKEVHVWTNRPVWPQGFKAAATTKGPAQEIPKGLDWNAWLGVAKDRPYRGLIDPKVKGYDPWDLCQNVYHPFSWRAFFDFGCGAFGDMACHTMNLAFRGLELGAVSDAVCTKIVSENDIAYPLKSVVKLTYKERESIVRPGVKLPAVTLYWYDGNVKPDAAIMPKWAAKHEGKVPNTGCYIIGSKGAVLMQDDYGAKCAIDQGCNAEYAVFWRFYCHQLY